MEFIDNEWIELFFFVVFRILSCRGKKGYDYGNG